MIDSEASAACCGTAFISQVASSALKEVYTQLEKPDNTFMSGPRHHYLFFTAAARDMYGSSATRYNKG